MKPSTRHRIALALLLLFALAGLLPTASRAGVSPAARAISTAAAGDEAEPNNTYPTASPIQLDPLGGNLLQKTMLGTIDSRLANDNRGQNGDWYRFFVPKNKGGASVSIGLTSLPADYDIALFNDLDPAASTLPISDGVDLGNIAD